MRWIHYSLWLLCLGTVVVRTSEAKDREKKSRERKKQQDKRRQKLTRGKTAGNGETTAKILESPVLAGLTPNSGPRDGGTRVSVRALGLDTNTSFLVSFRSVHRRGEVMRTPIKTIPLKRLDGEYVFTTPNFTRFGDIGLGVLTSLSFHKDLLAENPRPITNPVFFRLMEPLESLRPVSVKPCCKFSISGGKMVLLSGSTLRAPAHHAIVRFSGYDHEQEVDGQVVQGEWAMLPKDAPRNVWHVYAVTPPWPHAEEDVDLEISWNEQQFSAFTGTLDFVEDVSFFGEAVGHISEEHLTHADPEGTARGAKAHMETVSVIGKEHDSQVLDMTHVMLLSHTGDSFILARSNDLTHLQEDMRIVHDIFILNLAAMAGGALASPMRMPTIIGFLLGGVVVGPGCLDMITELVQVESIAELGVCLLLFSLGLELTWGELFANVHAAVAGLMSMAILCGVIVFVAAFWLRTSLSEAACIGLFAALSSTPVSLKSIPTASTTTPTKKPQNESGALLAILITQDIVLAGMLAVMPLVFKQTSDTQKFGDIVTNQPGTNGYVWTLLSGTYGSSFLAVVMMLQCILGTSLLYRRRHFLQTLFNATKRVPHDMLQRMDKDLVTVAMLSYVFACSYLFDWMGLSLELGAFLSGLLLASLSVEFAKYVEHHLSPLKDTFLAWFFASIGLVVNPHFLCDNLRHVLSVAVFVFLLKLFAGFLPLWLLSPQWRKVHGDEPPLLAAMRISWILAHISEFGFVLASKGTSWGVLSRHVYLLLVGANVLSLCLAPWLFHLWEFLQAGPRSPPATPIQGHLGLKAMTQAASTKDHIITKTVGNPSPFM